jgi:hypothetical protein
MILIKLEPRLTATAAEYNDLRNSAQTIYAILSSIVDAHQSGNNGACNGEAVLCTNHATLGRDALDKAANFFPERLKWLQSR